MIIQLSPIRSDRSLLLEKTGDILTINGEPFDFSVIPDEGLLSNDAITSDFIISDVERKNGEIELTLLCPHSSDATEAQRFPEPITVTEDGEVQLP